MKKTIILFFASLQLFANLNNNDVEDNLFERALNLSKKFLIIDTHIDIPYRLKNNWEDISNRTEKGHFDYVRAVEGGLDAAFMAIFIPARYEIEGGSVELADSLIDMIENIVAAKPKKFAIALNVNDVKKHFSSGIVSLPMGLENGTPIQGSLENLKHFYKRGIRYITLAHGKANHICDSSYDLERKWNGLSPFGKTLISEMNNLGIIVDISHVTDSTFYQVLEITKTPVIASHSSCRYFTPNFERNISDVMIKKLAENNGVIQITFGSYFISGDFNAKMSELDSELKEKNIRRWSAEGKEYFNNFVKDNNIEYGTAEDVANHIDHVVKLVGINHVGLGSDFDGISNLPTGIEDVSKYPRLIYELLKKGYSEEDIEKICSGNFFRVWKEVEDYAKPKY